jgi:purine nucleosidase
LAAITTVGGNQTLHRVTTNARTVATVGHLTGVPIVAGSAHPLVRTLATAPDIHGESGLDGPAPVPLTAELTPGHGPQFLAETVLADPGRVTVVATGPLTNLALALRLYPELADAVQRVVLMGGSYTRGNVTPAAEFNIFVDPEAAAVVFGAGWDVTMIGLDVTHQALYTPEVAQRLAAIDTAAARWTHELLAFFTASYRATAQMVSPPVHDAVAMACVIDPSLVPVRDAVVQVECASPLTAGMTVVDFGTGAHHVGVGLDAERFWELVLAALAALP